MSDAQARMWSYWRDKYGAVGALDYYPNKLASTPALQQAIYAVQAAEALIEQIMSNLPDEDEE